MSTPDPIRFIKDISVYIGKFLGKEHYQRYMTDGKIIYKKDRDGSDLYGFYFTLTNKGVNICFIASVFNSKYDKQFGSNVYKSVEIQPDVSTKTLYEFLMEESQKIISENIVEQKAKLRTQLIAQQIKTMLGN